MSCFQSQSLAADYSKPGVALNRGRKLKSRGQICPSITLFHMHCSFGVAQTCARAKRNLFSHSLLPL